MIAADYPFLDVLWTMLIFFLWVIWFWILFTVVFDVFRRFDVPDLYASLSPRRWIAVDPIDGDFAPIEAARSDFGARLRALTSP